MLIALSFGLAYAFLIGKRQVTIGVMTNYGYGVAFLLMAAFLMLTYRARRQWLGYLAATLGATLFGLLAWDTFNTSTASAFVCVVMAWACIGESGLWE